jgi:hypothetical protein
MSQVNDPIQKALLNAYGEGALRPLAVYYLCDRRPAGERAGDELNAVR